MTSHHDEFIVTVRYTNSSKDPSRHAPHTKYVNLMKGLNDVPVCTVGEKIHKLEGASFKYFDIYNRSLSCPDGLNVDDIGDFKLELVRRHNPHARRVCHIKGLNDVPVCVVRDDLNSEWENRFIVSPGSMTLVKPKKRTLEKIGDITDRSSRASSRVSVPKMSLLPPENEDFEDLNEELDSIQALDILCSILQTNSLQTVQAWIEQATDEERNVVLKALRDMKEKGVLPKSTYTPRLPEVPENKVSLSYEKDWNQTKSVEEAAKAEPVKVASPPAIGTQTPVSVLKDNSRPSTRIQMSGLSRQSRPPSNASRPSTMKSVREKFLSSQMSSGSGVAKDPGFTWAIKHKNASPNVVSKA